MVWTDLVNVTASGNAVQKTGGCDGCADAAALSQQQINSGSGYLEFAVSETNLVRFIGLNNNSTGTGVAEIPFAFKLVSGYAEVHEHGQYRRDVPVVTGDVLRISVDSGVVTYAKNDVVFHTSGGAPVYPLRVDTALINLDTTLIDVRIAGSAVALSGPREVVWTEPVNVSISGNALQKTGGCDGCDDAGAVSEQEITAGNGYLEFTVSETNLLRLVGLGNGSSNAAAADIPFALYLSNGYAEVRERGLYRADIPIATSDVLRIEVQSGIVSYSKNDVVFYTSGGTPVYPMRVHAALISLGSTVNNAIISDSL